MTRIDIAHQGNAVDDNDVRDCPDGWLMDFILLRKLLRPSMKYETPKMTIEKRNMTSMKCQVRLRKLAMSILGLDGSETLGGGGGACGKEFLLLLPLFSTSI